MENIKSIFDIMYYVLRYLSWISKWIVLYQRIIIHFLLFCILYICIYFNIFLFLHYFYYQLLIKYKYVYYI